MERKDAFRQILSRLPQCVKEEMEYIPQTLIEETEKIMQAQAARGADFESGNLMERGKAMIPLLVPLFLSAFKRADELAIAMEARCYHGGENRTRLKPLQYTAKDRVALLALLLMLALAWATRMV